MTPMGGKLWESERLPDWTRRVTDVYGGSRCADSLRHRVSIFGHSPVITRAYFDAGSRCGLLDFGPGPIRTGVGRRRLIYWRPPQTVYLLSAWVESWIWRVDWDRMESMR